MPVGSTQHVPGVGVGVVQAVVQHLAEERGQQPVGPARPLDARRVDRLAIGRPCRPITSSMTRTRSVDSVVYTSGIAMPGVGRPVLARRRMPAVGLAAVVELLLDRRR